MSYHTGTELKKFARFARATAQGAGRILRDGFTRRMSVVMKGRIDPVTEYDLKAERYIVSRIEKTFPAHAILTEEGSGKGKESLFRWIIDPLDGTVNFSHGFPLYCVSIALEFDGEVIVGAVYDPERNEMFWGIQSQGAWLGTKRLRVSGVKKLERALLATGFAYDIGTSPQNNLGYFARMAKRAQGIRRPGSAAIDLCWLAAARLDGFWELKLSPWDAAAGALLVREAGGTVTTMRGKNHSVYGPDILASNRHLHIAMQNALRGKR